MAPWPSGCGAPARIAGRAAPSPDPTSASWTATRPAAARLWQDLGSPYEAALALLASREEEALREALPILAGLGATAAVRVARQTMRTLGFRSIPAGPAHRDPGPPAGPDPP